VKQRQLFCESRSERQVAVGDRSGVSRFSISATSDAGASGSDIAKRIGFKIQSKTSKIEDWTRLIMAQTVGW